jgi:hypothetical protein
MPAALVDRSLHQRWIEPDTTVGIGRTKVQDAFKTVKTNESGRVGDVDD